MPWKSGIAVERVMGIEPTWSAWEAEVLPLNYTRTLSLILPNYSYVVNTSSEKFPKVQLPFS